MKSVPGSKICVLTGDRLLAGKMLVNQIPGAVYPMKSLTETVR